MNVNVFGFVCIIQLTLTMCFYPKKPFGTGVNTKSHSDITNRGCMLAFDQYIITNKNVNSVEEFFAEDPEGYEEMRQKMFSLSKHVGDTQITKRDTAYIHCHADQIELAHRFVKSCKKSLIKLKDDLDELRRKLGECLYTIQSFYSNTNWVEMNGDKTNDDFGLTSLMNVVSPAEDTCQDIPDSNDCTNNLLVHDKLTSGYYHGRGNTKPAKPLGSLRGKCSHGGPYDNSSRMVARCGINKDTLSKSFSPHYHLHTTAYRAAFEATRKFLILNGTGVRDILGDDIFDTLFHIKARTNMSLAFAIDYTSSMTEEMTAVKNNVIQLLTSIIGSNREPADYVISLFHDPETFNRVYIYKDGYDMINRMTKLSTVAGNNPDCPEYAVAGMLNAIEKMRAHSPLLVFTDADAKDYYRKDELVAKAFSKNISIFSFITSQCSKRRSSGEPGTVRRQRSISFFESISKLTGGTLFHINKQNTGQALTQLLEKTFPSKEVIIDSFDWTSAEEDEKMFPVDSTISVLKISVTGTHSKGDIGIFYVNGTEEKFTSAKSIKIRTINGESIFSMQRPSPGLMKIKRLVKNSLILNITGQSLLKVKMEFWNELQDIGNIDVMKGNPITGKHYSVGMSVYNLKENGTLGELHFVEHDGAIISSETCNEVRSEFQTECIVAWTMPNTPFRLKLFGIDEYGYNFSRKLPKLFKPRHVELIVTSNDGDAILNKDMQVTYKIINYGIKLETFLVTLKTKDDVFIKGLSYRQHNISSQQSVTGVFILHPTIPSVILSYSVAVSLSASREVQQTITKKLLISDVERPSCSIRNSSGICEESSLNTANCSSYKWNASAEVNFSGTVLDTISTTGQTVQTQYRNITNLYTGPLEIKLSGDCCTPILYLTVVDVEDYITQCKLEFSSNGIIKSVKLVSKVVEDYARQHTLSTGNNNGVFDIYYYYDYNNWNHYSAEQRFDQTATYLLLQTKSRHG